MSVALLLSGIFFGILTARAGTIAARGNIEPTHPAVIFINFGSMISTFAIIVWGFLNLQWWIPLAGFIVISLFVGVIVGRSTWPVFYQAIPITGVITIAVTGYAWFS
tara:strand:- start:894 stop:1214 length:321 start_codon:yes stop_codon:yes gene_type:complete